MPMVRVSNGGTLQPQAVGVFYYNVTWGSIKALSSGTWNDYVGKTLVVVTPYLNNLYVNGTLVNPTATYTVSFQQTLTIKYYNITIPSSPNIYSTDTNGVYIPFFIY